MKEVDLFNVEAKIFRAQIFALISNYDNDTDGEIISCLREYNSDIGDLPGQFQEDIFYAVVEAVEGVDGYVFNRGVSRNIFWQGQSLAFMGENHISQMFFSAQDGCDEPVVHFTRVSLE